MQKYLKLYKYKVADKPVCHWFLANVNVYLVCSGHT